MNARRRGVGSLAFLAVYTLALVAMFLATSPPERSGADLAGLRNRFNVALVLAAEDGGAPRYRGTTLAGLDEPGGRPAGATFLLSEPRIDVEQRDIHRAVVVEDHGVWQLLEYHYSNTITSTSRYRAWADRVEPVAYRVTSHVGQAMYAMFLLVPAYGLSVLLAWWWRKRGAAPQTGDPVDN